jgi:histidinol-phosphatase
MDDLELAQYAALRGAEVAMRYYTSRDRLWPISKADGSPVTEADRDVEMVIRDVLTRARPDDAILGEEFGSTGRGERRWIVDPIDGTCLFLTGDDRWLVLVALESAGEATAGVAVVPAQRRVFWARRGGGAFEADICGMHLSNHRSISVDNYRPNAVLGSRLATIPAGDLRRTDRELMAPLTELTSTRPWPTHPALLVARGDLDLAIQLRGQVWDYAALTCIITEAGGWVSGVHGQEPPTSGTAIYARSRALQAAAMQLLQPETDPRRASD